MDIITVQLDKDLLNEVLQITQNKFPLRKIKAYAEATREALIEFIKKNQRYKTESNPSENQIKSESEA